MLLLSPRKVIVLVTRWPSLRTSQVYVFLFVGIGHFVNVMKVVLAVELRPPLPQCLLLPDGCHSAVGHQCQESPLAGFGTFSFPHARIGS